MQISPTTSASYQQVGNHELLNRVNHLFQELGSALESGSLADARKILSQLRTNASAAKNRDISPVAQRVEVLSKALESGDIEAAQEVYKGVKQMMSERSSGGGQVRGMGGSTQGGAHAREVGNSTNANSRTASSAKIFDPQDTDKDGTVTWAEELLYSFAHPEEATKESIATRTENFRTAFDATA